MYVYTYIIICMCIPHASCKTKTHGSQYGCAPRDKRMTARGERVTNTLQHTTAYCNTLQHTATHCHTLQHTATHCSTNDTLQHNTTHATHCNTCNTLQHTAAHCNTQDLGRGILAHKTATHCDTLQHTVTHCNVLQHTRFRLRSFCPQNWRDLL